MTDAAKTVGFSILIFSAPASAQALTWVVIVVVSAGAVAVIVSRRLGAYRKGGISRAALAGGIAWDLVQTAAIALAAVFIASKAVPAAAPVAARLAEAEWHGSGAIVGIAAGVSRADRVFGRGRYRPKGSDPANGG